MRNSSQRRRSIQRHGRCEKFATAIRIRLLVETVLKRLGGWETAQLLKGHYASTRTRTKVKMLSIVTHACNLVRQRREDQQAINLPCLTRLKACEGAYLKRNNGGRHAGKTTRLTSGLHVHVHTGAHQCTYVYTHAHGPTCTPT